MWKGADKQRGQVIVGTNSVGQWERQKAFLFPSTSPGNCIFPMCVKVAFGFIGPPFPRCHTMSLNKPSVWLEYNVCWSFFFFYEVECFTEREGKRQKVREKIGSSKDRSNLHTFREREWKTKCIFNITILWYSHTSSKSNTMYSLVSNETV